MKERKTAQNVNRWWDICRQNSKADEETKVDVLEEILRAPKENAQDLKRLADNRDNHGIYRRNAIRRLVNIEPNLDTAEWLRGVFLDQENDDDVRAFAYEDYRYLRIINGKPSTEKERMHDRSLMPNERSLRMKWLTRMKD